MCDEWQNLLLAQVNSLSDWDNEEDEVWNNVPAVWTDSEFREMSLHQALRGMENEPKFYTLADLKERWR